MQEGSNTRCSELLCFQFRKCFDANVSSSSLNVYHLYTVENNVQGLLSPSSVALVQCITCYNEDHRESNLKNTKLYVFSS